MKYLKYFLILLLIPFIVLAEECDVSKITITSIEQSEISGNTEEISEPTIKNRNINFNLKMYDVNDSVTYDMVIKNDSEEDYMIDEDTFKTDSDYIEYSLKTNDNNNVVKANSTKDVTLIVTYKKEVEDNKLTNNKFDASNNLKLSLNTNEKEKELEVITTDNIKESVDPIKVTNPQTAASNIKIIIEILLLVTMIIVFIVYSKKKYVKYFIILTPLFIIPVVYAICKVDVEVKSIIEIEKLPKLYDTLVGLSNEQNACVTKYEGQVTDQVGQTVNANRVYFDKCSEQRNVIFGGFCWQVIRTTETGGTKLIYNGEPVDGKCEGTREQHQAIRSVEDIYPVTINSNYLYSSSFSYNLGTKEFTLIDPQEVTWSDTTYEDLLGKFTCKNLTGTCNSLYSINSYESNTTAEVLHYTISSQPYPIIGTSQYNTTNKSLSTVGYMYNKVYKQKLYDPGTTEYKAGTSFTYDNSTNTYTLSGTVVTYDNWYDDYSAVKDTKYTCWNTSGVCDTISYIYSTTFSTGAGSGAYYIDFTGGKSIQDVVNEMLYNDDVNKYNSSVKGIIDSWYKNNLINYANKIEDTVYCNNRNIEDYGGWDASSNNLKLLTFKNYVLNNNLSCSNLTDQFSTNNNLAKLIYPIALVSNEELFNINEDSLLMVNKAYFTMSPSYYYYSGGSAVREIALTRSFDTSYVDKGLGVRPVISLSNINTIMSGTGSEDNPWVIK